MGQEFRLNRRAVLARLAVGFASSLAGSSLSVARDTNKLLAGWASPEFKPEVEIELVCERDEAQILDGPPTKVWRYKAKLIKGPESALRTISDSYLGPVMRFTKGQRVRIHLRNQLPEWTITHWHGLHVPMEADGHPMYAVEPGGRFVYEFEVRNRAGMNFFHPHTHEATATQVYRGLAGLIFVNDDEEKSLELPAGDYELPIVIQDRTLDADNQLVYGGGMHRSMFGFYGNRVLVNGKADYSADVGTRAYRLRVLNASNARIYKLAWDDGSPIVVIGVDGGLLEHPETKPYVMLAPAERLDIWVDFSGRPIGSQLALQSSSFAGVLPKMAQRMLGAELPVGAEFPIMTFRIARSMSNGPALPEKLASIKRISERDLANPNDPTPIGITEAPMSMLINGRPYAENDIQPRERIPLGTTQLIEIFHDHASGRGGHMGMMGGMGMGPMMGGMRGMGMFTMAHPIHLHGQQFQIIKRSFEGDDEGGYATIRDGFIDAGFKDTVLVAPGERILIAKPFEDFKGRFMYHCHNLEHEDMGMMREFLVE